MNLQDKTTSQDLAYHLAKSLRPRMIIVSWLVYTCIVVIHNAVDLPSIIFGFFLFVALYGIVALQNDISDAETDKINQRKDIPYSLGLLTHKQVVVTILVLSILATIIGYILNYQVLLWVFLYIALGYAYSGPLNIKSKGMLAALLLGFCYGAMPWLIGASVTGELDQYSLIFLAFASCIYSSGIIVIKDFKDVKGDRATGKKTLLVQKGALFTRRYYLIVTSLAYVLVVTYATFLLNNVLAAFVGIVAAVCNYWLLASTSLFSKASARSVRGKWSRVLFFSYALTLYFISTFFVL